MAYWFPPHIAMNQPQVHVRPLPLEAPPSPPTPSTPLGFHRALGLSCLGYRAPSRWRSVLHVVMERSHCSCLNAAHPLLPPLCPQVCSLSASTDALQIGSSVPPSFQIPHICVNGYLFCAGYLFFSFQLTSLRIKGSKFIHLFRTESNAFLFLTVGHTI